MPIADSPAVIPVTVGAPATACGRETTGGTKLCGVAHVPVSSVPVPDTWFHVRSPLKFQE